ncbi:MAG TPA: Crp/Fnr family transcriptional regulator [Thermomicrobiales bacterium]
MSAVPPHTSPQSAWTIERRSALLAAVPFFASLPPAVIGELAALFHAKTIPRGDFVFHEGQPAETVHIAATGRLKIIRTAADGRQIVLRLIQPGEPFGVAGGWGAVTYPASARALDHAVVLQLPAREFSRYLHRHPALALAVLNDLAARLREAEARILDAETANVEARIARALLRLVGPVTPGGTAQSVVLSRQDLADLTGTTLSTASRVLSARHRRGIVLALRERVTILDAAALAVLAGEG